MAIVLEFIDFVVRRSTIEEKYPGGWAGCLRNHRHAIGGRVWYDDYLFRDGAMNPIDMQSITDGWERLGFELRGEVDGKPVWKDACVVEGMLGGATLPCSWIEVDSGKGIAYLAGTEPGTVIGRGDNKHLTLVT